MMLAARKLLAIGSMILIAGLMLFVMGCGTEVNESTAPASTTAGPATMLSFTTQPADAISGLAFDAQPMVAVKDARGNVVTNYQGLIELSVTTGTGDRAATLFGGTKIVLTNGAAEFKYLSIDKAGVGYTLTASSGNLIPAISEPFAILPGAPAKLVFSVQPSGGKAGTPLTPSPEVKVQDINGNTVNTFDGSISISASVTYPNYNATDQNQPGTITVHSALSGITTVQMVNGVARFTNISSVASRPNYTLTASSDSLTSATSSYFTILPADPVKLEFTVQPSGCKAGIPFETQPKVAIVDAFGNVVTSSRASITMSISPDSGAAGANLSGTNTLKAEYANGGLAEFEDLSIDLTGSGYMLTATVSGLPSANSQAFDVSAP